MSPHIYVFNGLRSAWSAHACEKVHFTPIGCRSKYFDRFEARSGSDSEPELEAEQGDEPAGDRGADRWRAVPIPDAVLGTAITVETLDGEEVLMVPAGTQSNRVLCLKEKGLPRFGRLGRGDLDLRVQIAIPTVLTKQEEELYRRLGALRQPEL